MGLFCLVFPDRWLDGETQSGKKQQNNFHSFLLAAFDCGALTDPANGAVKLKGGTTYTATAEYSCNTGYTFPTGASVIRRCGVKGWSGSKPSCQG